MIRDQGYIKTDNDKEIYEKNVLKLRLDFDKRLNVHKILPKEHPEYFNEWKNFWLNRCKQLEKDDLEPSEWDLPSEFNWFWPKRILRLHHQMWLKTIKELQNSLDVPESTICNKLTKNIDIAKEREIVSARLELVSPHLHITPILRLLVALGEYFGNLTKLLENILAIQEIENDTKVVFLSYHNNRNILKKCKARLLNFLLPLNHINKCELEPVHAALSYLTELFCQTEGRSITAFPDVVMDISKTDKGCSLSPISKKSLSLEKDMSMSPISEASYFETPQQYRHGYQNDKYRRPSSHHCSSYKKNRQILHSPKFNDLFYGQRSNYQKSCSPSDTDYDFQYLENSQFPSNYTNFHKRYKKYAEYDWQLEKIKPVCLRNRNNLKYNSNRFKQLKSYKHKSYGYTANKHAESDLSSKKVKDSDNGIKNINNSKNSQQPNIGESLQLNVTQKIENDKATKIDNNTNIVLVETSILPADRRRVLLTPEINIEDNCKAKSLLNGSTHNISSNSNISLKTNSEDQIKGFGQNKISRSENITRMDEKSIVESSKYISESKKEIKTKTGELKKNNEDINKLLEHGEQRKVTDLKYRLLNSLKSVFYNDKQITNEATTFVVEKSYKENSINKVCKETNDIVDEKQEKKLQDISNKIDSNKSNDIENALSKVHNVYYSHKLCNSDKKNQDETRENRENPDNNSEQKIESYRNDKQSFPISCTKKNIDESCEVKNNNAVNILEIKNENISSDKKDVLNNGKIVLQNGELLNKKIELCNNTNHGVQENSINFAGNLFKKTKNAIIPSSNVCNNHSSETKIHNNIRISNKYDEKYKSTINYEDNIHIYIDLDSDTASTVILEDSSSDGSITSTEIFDIKDSFWDSFASDLDFNYVNQTHKVSCEKDIKMVKNSSIDKIIDIDESTITSHSSSTVNCTPNKKNERKGQCSTIYNKIHIIDKIQKEEEGSIGDKNRSPITECDKTCPKIMDNHNLIDSVSNSWNFVKSEETSTNLTEVIKTYSGKTSKHNSDFLAPIEEASDIETNLNPSENIIIKKENEGIKDLSDCDLNILLTNFPVLGAEEQYGLLSYIASLKISDHARFTPLHQQIHNLAGRITSLNIEESTSKLILNLLDLNSDKLNPSIIIKIEKENILCDEEKELAHLEVPEIKNDNIQSKTCKKDLQNTDNKMTLIEKKFKNDKESHNVQVNNTSKESCKIRSSLNLVDELDCVHEAIGGTLRNKPRNFEEIKSLLHEEKYNSGKSRSDIQTKENKGLIRKRSLSTENDLAKIKSKVVKSMNQIKIPMKIIHRNSLPKEGNVTFNENNRHETVGIKSTFNRDVHVNHRRQTTTVKNNHNLSLEKRNNKLKSEVQLLHSDNKRMKYNENDTHKVRKYSVGSKHSTVSSNKIIKPKKNELDLLEEIKFNSNKKTIATQTVCNDKTFTKKQETSNIQILHDIAAGVIKSDPKMKIQDSTSKSNLSMCYLDNENKVKPLSFTIGKKQNEKNSKPWNSNQTNLDIKNKFPHINRNEIGNANQVTISCSNNINTPKNSLRINEGIGQSAQKRNGILDTPNTWGNSSNTSTAIPLDDTQTIHVTANQSYQQFMFNTSCQFCVDHHTMQKQNCLVCKRGSLHEVRSLNNDNYYSGYNYASNRMQSQDIAQYNVPHNALTYNGFTQPQYEQSFNYYGLNQGWNLGQYQEYQHHLLRYNGDTQPQYEQSFNYYGLNPCWDLGQYQEYQHH